MVFLCFVLPPQEGRTYVGREDASTEQDISEFVTRIPCSGMCNSSLRMKSEKIIFEMVVSMSSSAVLHGLDLESEHCMFQNENGKVTLVPLGGAQCSVNGVQVTEPSQLNQGETTETCDVSSAVFTSLSENMFRPSEMKVLTVYTLWSRCCYSARQDQHVSVQPSEGGGQAAGETKGETVSLETGPA